MENEETVKETKPSVMRGRKEIFTSYSEINENNLRQLINESMKLHMENQLEIKSLLEIYKGVQSIISREKDVRPEINNREVINYAMMITRVISGYFMGEPIKYTSLNPDEDIDSFNDSLRNSGNDKANSEVEQYASITGVGYKYTQYYKDNIRFTSLNPMTTYVVKKNDVFKESIAGVTYIKNVDEQNNFKNVTYQVYVDGGVYEITSTSGFEVNSANPISYKKTGYDIPIIEYPNNMFRIGDFEPVIGLLNLINKTTNDRMNAIEQFVQNLLIFINCELKDEKDYDKIRQKGYLTLKNKLPQSGNSDIKVISETLDQDATQSFVDNLKEMLFEIVGIPDRKTTGGGSGDTGQAVELRDGWQDLETVARNKQLQYEFSERQMIRVVLQILHAIQSEEVTINERDIQINFSRNKNSNLIVKTQGLQTLLETKTLTPTEALKVVDLVSDIEEYIKKGQEFWGDEFANKTKQDEGGLENVDNGNDTGDQQTIVEGQRDNNQEEQDERN